MTRQKNLKSADDVHMKQIKAIMDMERRDLDAMSTSDRIASYITSFSGSMLYVILHVIWFAVWILLNVGLFHLKPFDPFPFSFLTMAVSLEAIFLSSFVLISQNKQALQADKRAKIDLEINMMSERENTKMIHMLAEIQQKLHIKSEKDSELRIMKKTTEIEHLSKAIDKAEKKKK